MSIATSYETSGARMLSLCPDHSQSNLLIVSDYGREDGGKRWEQLNSARGIAPVKGQDARASIKGKSY